MSHDLEWLDRILAVQRPAIAARSDEETLEALARALYEHTFELRRVRAMVAVLCKTLVDGGLVGEDQLMRALIDAVHAAEAGMLDPDAPPPLAAEPDVQRHALDGGDPYRGAAPPILDEDKPR